MDNQTIKQHTLYRLKDHWGVSIGTAAAAAMLGGMLVGTSFLPQWNYNIELPELFQYAVNLTGGLIASIPFLGLVQFILGGVLQLGYAKFLLKQHDGRKYDFNDLFSEFNRFGTGFAQAFLRGLYTALWSLLLIVPGIMASYSYAMTPFLLSDYPTMTASDAIAYSKQMMGGHKMDLFILDLSFLGWALLAALSLNIGNLWLNPYRNASYAVFYRNLMREIRRQ